jgi:hypothetical protein
MLAAGGYLPNNNMHIYVCAVAFAHGAQDGHLDTAFSIEMTPHEG